MAAIAALVGVVGGISGMLVGWLTHARSTKRAIREDATTAATATAEMRKDIGYIKQGIDDLKMEQRAIDREIGDVKARQNDHGERIAKVEASAKQAHLRLDRMEHVANR